MSIPGFTAEATIYKSGGCYAATLQYCRPRGFSYLPHSSADWRRRRLRCLGLLVELVLRLRLHSRPARQLALLRLSMRTVHLALLTDLADLRWRFRTHGRDIRDLRSW